jgi:N-acetylated-alpha-linked acidic dipeptidase
MKKVEQMRVETEVQNQMIRQNNFVYASDPQKKYVPPSVKDAVPYLDFSSIQNEMAALKTSIDRFSDLSASNPNPATGTKELNKLLYQSEQELILEKGLPDREWYKHAIYAPGYYTGYGVKTIPGFVRLSRTVIGN